MDHQWVADLDEVQRLAKHNGGTWYLLTVLDVLSKYAWVEPLKDKTGRSLAQAWERLSNGRIRVVRVKRIKAKNFTIARFNRP